MRIKNPGRVRQWPLFCAMLPMLKKLSMDPDSAFLGCRMTLGADGPTIVQYSGLTQNLYAYAFDPHAMHRPAWARFNRLTRKEPATVELWHETFVAARSYRSVDRWIGSAGYVGTAQEPPA